jgi:hypothetical protein
MNSADSRHIEKESGLEMERVRRLELVNRVLVALRLIQRQHQIMVGLEVVRAPPPDTEQEPDQRTKADAYQHEFCGFRSRWPVDTVGRRARRFPFRLVITGHRWNQNTRAR